ncbi:MAG: gamma-glutamyltransferase family protein [Ectothiorhodospiraceae bacterium]|nr:gamma-glutamyltransferase family protein [Ectothiorhodospiraceae bacterium]
MLKTQKATRGMVTAPHALAAQAGQRILREGGNAIEAMIAVASTLAVVYPHMTGIGGDGFWLLSKGGEAPTGVEAAGRAAGLASIEYYRERGIDTIPFRGPDAALTVAGTISGWMRALETSRQWGGRMPLTRLLEDAIHYARHGFPVTESQHHTTAAKLGELCQQPGFATQFLVKNEAPQAGSVMRLPKLAQTLEQLARAGLADFYTGELASSISGDLQALDTPLRSQDLATYSADLVTPLAMAHPAGTLYNMPPPTQGLAALLILGIAEHAGVGEHIANDADYVHLMVEATKKAFQLRDWYVRDPDQVPADLAALLTAQALADEAGKLRMDQAQNWPHLSDPSDTTWAGAIDGDGNAVSFIQSVYHEYGSGVVLPDTGICWQNRGASFRLQDNVPNSLAPGRKPFHTLNPALARLSDGRLLIYGTMGGDGQPQTQSVIFSRFWYAGMDLQAAITAPRWLQGRTWGQASDTLKLEQGWPDQLVETLKRRGHPVEVLPRFSETFGHAGAVLRHPDGVLEGASDPRSDGAAIGY